MGIGLWIFVILLLIYFFCFRIAGGIIKGLYNFFRSVMHDSMRGHQFQESGSMLGGFLLTVGFIAFIVWIFS